MIGGTRVPSPRAASSNAFSAAATAELSRFCLAARSLSICRAEDLSVVLNGWSDVLVSCLANALTANHDARSVFDVTLVLVCSILHRLLQVSLTYSGDRPSTLGHFGFSL